MLLKCIPEYIAILINNSMVIIVENVFIRNISFYNKEIHPLQTIEVLQLEMIRRPHLPRTKLLFKHMFTRLTD